MTDPLPQDVFEDVVCGAGPEWTCPTCGNPVDSPQHEFGCPEGEGFAGTRSGEAEAGAVAPAGASRGSGRSKNLSAAPLSDVRERGFPVVEVFGPTIQGEGPDAGSVCFFLRLGGCDYRCLTGDTQVLLPNLRERALADIEVGDVVAGYARPGAAQMGPNRLVTAVVQAKRELPPEPTVKITLDDGTIIRGAGDHRLWREFRRKNGEVYCRPGVSNYIEMRSLTEGSILKGPGASVRSLPRSDLWMRGYVVGSWEGDGHIGRVAQFEVVSRSFFDTVQQTVEATVGVPLREWRPGVTDTGTTTYRGGVPAAYIPLLRTVMQEFLVDESEFCRGYLAGLFDAEGHVDDGHLYITQNVGPVVDHARAAAATLQIETRHWTEGEGPGSRVLLLQHPVTLMPFLDIGCEEKRLRAGSRGLRHLRRTVVSVEPGPCLPLFDIQTDTENFVANGIVSHNCSWCDSMYAVEPAEVRKAERLSAEAIAERLSALSHGLPGLVILSGGNPALHRCEGLLALLHAAGWRVSIETQGSVWRDWIGDCDRVVISPKPPSSGMVSDRHMRQADEFMARVYDACAADRAALKFVAFDEDDLDFAARFAARYDDLPFYLSAGTTQELGDWDTKAMVLQRYGWLCERVIDRPDLARARALPQLHVLAWGPVKGR